MGGGKHSLLQKCLVRVIDQVDSIYEAFPELRCTIEGRSIVPDVVVIAKDEIPLDDAGNMTSLGIDFAPAWVIEILSPNQSQTKVTGNILHCLKNGSQLAWLIDPETRSLLVYQPNQLPDLWTEAVDILPSQRKGIPKPHDLSFCFLAVAIKALCSSGLTLAPQTSTVCPTARMLLAALISRS